MPAKRKRTPGTGAQTEQRLLEAVEWLMRKEGLARITTRQIARAAGLAEGTLYNHFREKREIFLAVLKRNVAEFAHVVQDLPLRVGQATVLDNLRPVAQAAIGFHTKAAPLICSLLADQKLLAETRRAMEDLRIGPHRSSQALAAYIAAEQRLGRVNSDVAPEVAAGLILGTSFHMAVLEHFSGRPVEKKERAARMRDAVEAIVLGLAPRTVSREKKRP